ncbi:MAG: pentapeptide repeat-containing protein, partial [Rhodospirillales bacterium]
ADITGALLPSHMEDLEGKLRDILVEHSKWVESGGRAGKQADFSRHDLREKDLRRVSLGTAKFEYAVLAGCNLTGALLVMSDFSFADLRNANLQQADLRGARFNRANLSGANLTGARVGPMSIRGTMEYVWPSDLSLSRLNNTILRGTDLSHLNMEGANLEGADLRDADLTGANLKDAFCKGADFRGAQTKNLDCRGATGLELD